MWPDEQVPWHGPFVKTQADSLQAIGVQVDTLAIRSHAGRVAYLTSVPAVARLNRSCPYDVVHAHYGHSGLVARIQARVPLAITYWGSDLNAKPRRGGPSLTVKSRIEVAVFRQLARVASATMTQSDEMERALPRSCRHRNHIVPAGIDLERFRPLPRDEARGQLGWSNDEKVVLFAANPDRPVKNFPLAEEVHSRLAPTMPELRLRVAWGISPEEVPIWMSAADVLLLTSRLEGSPNVVKEAMACELPVVSTPVGDVTERVHGVAGCYVRPADPDPLAKAVLAALDNGRTPEARGALAPLGTEAVARRILGIYDGLVGRG